MKGYLGGHRVRERRARLLTRAVIPVTLVAGVLFGIGFAARELSTSDGLTWLSDAMRGEAVQQENRLKVAPAVEVLLNKEQLYVVDRVRGS